MRFSFVTDLEQIGLYMWTILSFNGHSQPKAHFRLFTYPTGTYCLSVGMANSQNPVVVPQSSCAYNFLGMLSDYDDRPTESSLDSDTEQSKPRFKWSLHVSPSGRTSCYYHHAGA